uniref:Uncharacterized protein n=1 Tax=Ixodes ricinus TaxID=34613 RepID=A0A090XEW0_IXORI
MKVRLSRQVPFAPTFFSLFHLRKVPPSLYRRWKLSGFVLSHHPRVSTIVFTESFVFRLMERMFACVSAFSKTLACPVWSLRGRPNFLTTDHFLRGNTSSPQRLRLLLFGAHRSGASPLEAAFLVFPPPRYRQDEERAQSSETGRQDDFRHSRGRRRYCHFRSEMPKHGGPTRGLGRNAYHQPTRVA